MCVFVAASKSVTVVLTVEVKVSAVLIVGVDLGPVALTVGVVLGPLGPGACCTNSWGSPRTTVLPGACCIVGVDLGPVALTVGVVLEPLGPGACCTNSWGSPRTTGTWGLLH